jgi:hypothetical protein
LRLGTRWEVSLTAVLGATVEVAGVAVVIVVVIVVPLALAPDFGCRVLCGGWGREMR